MRIDLPNFPDLFKIYNKFTNNNLANLDQFVLGFGVMSISMLLIMVLVFIARLSWYDVVELRLSLIHI